MTKLEYWIEGLKSSFDEHGVIAIDEQVFSIAKDVILFQDSRNLSFNNIYTSYKSELDLLRLELSVEKSKVYCDKCSGLGYIISHGPCYSSSTQCDFCNGQGRHS